MYAIRSYYDFAFEVMDYCERYQFDPSSLIIEMTEMEVYKHNPTMFENFARLRLNNVELAIDDFGAGYSSLIKLADLPFTEMKIDRALIKSCHRDDRKSAILSLIVSMAKQLNMRLVAEGVEDLETWTHLVITSYSIHYTKLYDHLRILLHCTASTRIQ